MLVREDMGAPAASLAELKDYLRITGSGEDGLLERLLASASALCEQFIGQWLIVGSARERVRADGSWQRLSARPVVSITEVEGVEAGGYAIDIDAAGDGWVRVRPGNDPVTVLYQAGLAEDADGLPEPIRQGIVRLAAEHFAAREGDGASPPAVVGALWRPFRRMRLT